MPEIRDAFALAAFVLVALGMLVHFFVNPSPCGASRTLKCTSTMQDVPITRGGVTYTTHALVQDCTCVSPGEP